MPNVWQISGGPASGPYADVMVRDGVALVGPGDTGPWRPGKALTGWPHTYIRLFASEVQQGDILLLRSGSSVLQAVGIVAGEYEHLDQFDDVNGWDLQHARRVRWFRLPEAHDFGSAVFTGPPFGRVTHAEVIPYSQRFVNSPPTDWQMASLPPLPAEEPDLEAVPEPLRDIVAVAQDLGGGLYWDDQAFGALPSESEMVAHLVVPFLRSLGWAQEHMAVEWQRTDLAVFLSLPRVPENCHLIIEAKPLGSGLDEALKQAKGYVDEIGAECDILVTNGVRYRLHARDRDYEAVAYANLCRLKRSAVELFERLKRP